MPSARDRRHASLVDVRPDAAIVCLRPEPDTPQVTGT
jgi:hypothetical protein